MIAPQDADLPAILLVNGLNQSMKKENVRFVSVWVDEPRLRHAGLSQIPPMIPSLRGSYEYD